MVHGFIDAGVAQFKGLAHSDLLAIRLVTACSTSTLPLYHMNESTCRDLDNLLNHQLYAGEWELQDTVSRNNATMGGGPGGRSCGGLAGHPVIR